MTMKGKSESGQTGTWIVRQIPTDLMLRTRMAALVQRKTVRQLLMDLITTHLQELERKGMLPREK
jgi:hypothetical protein